MPSAITLLYIFFPVYIFFPDFAMLLKRIFNEILIYIYTIIVNENEIIQKILNKERKMQND